MTTQHNVQAKLVDRPEISESFGDAIRQVWFDGNTWRISIDVLRLDNDAPGGQMGMTQCPSVRLVLSATAGLALIERLTALSKELEANGTLKRIAPPQPSGVTH